MAFRALRLFRRRAHLVPIRIQPLRRFSERQPRKGWTTYSKSPVFSGLLVFGLSLTAYGLYLRFYEVMTMWPPEIRHNLRQGLYAKRKGDLPTALLYLTRAWTDTRVISLEKLGPDPLLKLSGVGITLAGVLEDAGLTQLAYDCYAQALNCMLNRAPETTPDQSPDVKLTPEVKSRVASLAYKLGELANTLQKPSAEEEKWLSLSVQALITMSHGIARPNLEHKIFEELELPSWVTLNDVVAPFEALGTFFARTGKLEYASLLYSRAIVYLLSDRLRTPSIEDKCRGAQLIGNLVELSIRTHPSDNIPPEVLATAEARLKAALKITQAARDTISLSRHDLCEEVYAVLLYNFAMLRQFAGDVDTARHHFRQSLDQARATNMQEGILNAQTALSKLDS